MSHLYLKKTDIEEGMQWPHDGGYFQTGSNRNVNVCINKYRTRSKLYIKTMFKSVMYNKFNISS